MTSVREKIMERTAALSPEVEEQVVNHYVEKEKNRRSDALVKGMDKLTSLENDLKKIKPDQVQLDADGKELSSSYSKAKYEEKKKLEEQIGKLEKIIDKALTKAEFGDLYNV